MTKNIFRKTCATRPGSVEASASVTSVVKQPQQALTFLVDDEVYPNYSLGPTLSMVLERFGLRGGIGAGLGAGLVACVIALLFGSGSALAGQYMYHPGSVSTTGNTTLSQHMLSVSHNPAACSKVVRKGDGFRMSYLGNAGFYAELGELDNFEDEIDALVDLLEDDNITLDQAGPLETRFNNLLEEMGRVGYLKTAWDVSVPGFPMAMHFDQLGGNVCLELSATVQARGSVLDAPLDFREDEGFQTESSLYLKSAVQTHFSVTYSQPVLDYKNDWVSGNLVAGAKFKSYRLALSKQVIPFESFEDNDVSDVISDEYDQNQETSSTLGVDVGVLWDGGRYQVGLTIANLIEPTFDYGAVGSNCSTDSCFAAANFVTRGELNGREVHRMEAVTTVDASYAIYSNWFVAGSFDLADYNDAVGDDLQWMSVATSFMPRMRWIPGMRLGYRENLAGSKLSQLTFGMTLFGALNLDVLYGLDDIEVDDSTVPRSMAFNFGFEQQF